MTYSLPVSYHFMKMLFILAIYFSLFVCADSRCFLSFSCLLSCCRPKKPHEVARGTAHFKIDWKIIRFLFLMARHEVPRRAVKCHITPLCLFYFSRRRHTARAPLRPKSSVLRHNPTPPQHRFHYQLSLLKNTAYHMPWHGTGSPP